MTAGFPDFTQKGASPLDFLGALAVNTNGGQPFDITSLITPSHNGLLFVWVAALAYLGSGVYVEVDASLNIAALVPASLIPDGGEFIAPFPGVYITENAGNTCTVSVNIPFGVPGPALGNLLVFGINATPLTVPAIRRAQIGRGDTATGTIVAGATTTVLPAPDAGTYYRIKMLSWSLNVAPAAAAKVQFLQTGTGRSVWSPPVAVAASQHNEIALDLEADWGIQVQNLTSVNVPVIIAYELWSV